MDSSCPLYDDFFPIPDIGLNIHVTTPASRAPIPACLESARDGLSLDELLGSTNHIPIETLFQQSFPGASHESRGSVFGTQARSASATEAIDKVHASPFGAPSPSSAPQLPPKIGTRFSRGSLGILKNWLATHGDRPFPNDKEKSILQHQTGLSRTQIMNWMANARRRGKTSDTRLVIPAQQAESSSAAVEIPRRPDTPAPGNSSSFLNPLERWVDSPPDHEPATASAIALAIASASCDGCNASGKSTPYDTTQGSSASSVGTTQSSSGPAHSNDSQVSVGSSGALPSRRNVIRRRRKFGTRKVHKTLLTKPANKFQCTFCTETFHTKFTWQRHEKSLHLPLEKWICGQDGPRYLDSQSEARCTFCDQPSPDDSHIETHNYSLCHNRPVKERTFYRKDHLGQHLRLVHNLRPEDVGGRLDRWKAVTPTVQSVCGFCGIGLQTWDTRVDHLADHFKMGSSMADWKGDWGFSDSTLARVEHALPPYMISHEQKSPFPFSATNWPLESPISPYELLKAELVKFIDTQYDTAGRFPLSSELHLDACRIIFAAEIPSYERPERCSWLRDLIMSDEEIVTKARLSPFRSSTEGKLGFLGIIGKDSPFENCMLEAGLREFASSNNGNGLDDFQLHQEACRMIQQQENISSRPPDIPASWLLALARSSTQWLQYFCHRVNLPLGDHIEIKSRENAQVDLAGRLLRNCQDLDEQLSQSFDEFRQAGVEPDEDVLQQELSRLINKFGDMEWRDAALQDPSFVSRFRRKHIPWSSGHTVMPTYGEHANRPESSLAAIGMNEMTRVTPGSGGVPVNACSSSTTEPRSYAIKYFLNDPNYDTWVIQELSRWVGATMSPHNPKQHTPDNEELQHQARWIMYDDGDPFNQTAADNAEWLRRFKRDVGILKDGGPGLVKSNHLLRS